jgi:hypothetical protein
MHSPASLQPGIYDDCAVEHPKLNGGEEATRGEQKPAGVRILSSADFIKEYTPPDYLVDGLLQRQFFYSMTGKTGGGKTAIALFIAAMVALGKTVDGREYTKGRVLYLAGENPVDIQQRWIAMAQQHDFEPEKIGVYFIPGVFTVSEMAETIKQQVETLGGVSLVVIDTTAAYFEGDDENNNVQAGRYARMQRGLVKLPGGPTVLALCHPAKGVVDDNLVPRGGGAYLNEVDGNLTAQNGSHVVELHTQGKFRGADFAPIMFQLKTVTHDRLKDTKGRLISTVVAFHLSEAGESEMRKRIKADEDLLLSVIDTHPTASISELATHCGWAQTPGKPNKARVHRLLKNLETAKLVKTTREGRVVSDSGNAVLVKRRPR